MATAKDQMAPLLTLKNRAGFVEKVQVHETRSHTSEPEPSSSTEGFFQTPPILKNPLEDDIALQRSLKLFIPESKRETCAREVEALGDKSLSKPVLDLVADAEKNLPYLKTWDAWGRRQDELVTSEGWRKLSAIGVEAGMVAMGYENEHLQFSRTLWCLKYYVWCGSAVWTTCPSMSAVVLRLTSIGSLTDSIQTK